MATPMSKRLRSNTSPGGLVTPQQELSVGKPIGIKKRKSSGRKSGIYKTVSKTPKDIVDRKSGTPITKGDGIENCKRYPEAPPSNSSTYSDWLLNHPSVTKKSRIHAAEYMRKLEYRLPE